MTIPLTENEERNMFNRVSMIASFFRSIENRRLPNRTSCNVHLDTFRRVQYG